MIVLPDASLHAMEKRELIKTVAINNHFRGPKNNLSKKILIGKFLAKLGKFYA